MSKGGSSKKSRNPLQSILGLFTNVKFLFVFVCFVGILVASVILSMSAEKVTILLLGPVLVELLVLGVDQYFIKWIKNATVMRSVITSVFGVAIGSVLLVGGGAALIGGVIVIVLSGALIVFSGRKYYLTRNLGLKKQDLVTTVSMIVFLTSLLFLALGNPTLFMVSLLSSFVIFLYRAFVFTIIFVGLTAGILQTLIGEIAYSAVIIIVGVISILVGIYARHRQAVKLRMATAREEV